MNNGNSTQTHGTTPLTRLEKGLLALVCLVLMCPLSLPAAVTASLHDNPADTGQIPSRRRVRHTEETTPQKQETTSTREEEEYTDLTPPGGQEGNGDDGTVYLDAEVAVNDSIVTEVTDEKHPYGLEGKREFNPDPNRAVWLSALFPGLGEIYNRRYWKLPIIIGGFMGLGYATSWNNTQYQDYSQGFRDLMDSDPSTNSYMNFFPPNTSESDLDKTWLQNTMKSRRNYYRRNRDLCIICMVALYLLCMVDSYVDASLAHFDISPSLSMDLQPAMFVSPVNRRSALGLNWALTF